MTKLSTGNYIITNKADGQTLAIGRGAEDKSLLPKKVVSLPPSVEAPVWSIQLLDNGKYTLKIGGAPATEIDSEVYAVYLEQIRLTEWVITPTPQHVSEKGDRSAGWVLPKKESLTQVAVKPLVAALSLPPQYLPSERFEIIPIDSE
ncbi:hypothetical protein EW026_g4655 [Hermanssonia centrifuga]|uniref:Uncharacterized protein n=1 Tax=Hermanssonia centrifuga TaxID=98765 RepID=A0A4S4KHI5_9APHY|nr:hypothetical protein EW026_g4655 [Hermanssonia centrifuga]